MEQQKDYLCEKLTTMKKQHAPFLLFLGAATLGGMIFYQATSPFEWASLGGWILGISWVAAAFYLNKKG
jgi:hypothetical protein